ncbi:DUF3225 domain-containing protein [Bradyrhizobium neotropicale]|uniref:DUF3225 domain-containing protein n=1 Tax=Bradyrhizobium neotropicale TaxID=1497615 RepID=UPI001AD776B7|nr:DUF3225 domain-containing protein [Bradyrhizobium neotropicale]MBO4225755.1 DUF3225 domain-containing protein [Bradyrhizobium neotropicale]
MRTILFAVVLFTLGSTAAFAQQNDADARALFTRFVAAQNAHNISEVKSMLWKSPQMLFFSRGVETRGADAVAERFTEYYKGTWHLEPDMSKFRIATISNDVAQILVPIVFTRGVPGAQPQSDTFLISQTFIRDSQAWYVASILPIANTQLNR